MRRPRRSRAWWPIGLALMAVLVVPANGGVAAAREARTVPVTLVGHWSRTITAADWRKAVSEQFGVGVFSIRVKPSGAVQVYLPGGTYAWLTTRFSALPSGRLVIGALVYCAAKAGLYRWKVAGRLLTIRKLSDPNCGPRQGIFAGVWKRT